MITRRRRRAFIAPAPIKISRGFDHLDGDGDGRVSTAEFERAVIDYRTSTDPAAPGIR